MSENILFPYVKFISNEIYEVKFLLIRYINRYKNIDACHIRLSYIPFNVIVLKKL